MKKFKPGDRVYIRHYQNARKFAAQDVGGTLFFAKGGTYVEAMRRYGGQEARILSVSKQQAVYRLIGAVDTSVEGWAWPEDALYLRT